MKNGIQEQTDKVKVEPLLQRNCRLDHKVRQKLRMPRNKSKIQSLHQRYKIKVWSKEQSKRLISINKVQDPNKLTCSKGYPDA